MTADLSSAVVASVVPAVYLSHFKACLLYNAKCVAKGRFLRSTDRRRQLERLARGVHCEQCAQQPMMRVSREQVAGTTARRKECIVQQAKSTSFALLALFANACLHISLSIMLILTLQQVLYVPGTSCAGVTLEKLKAVDAVCAGP